MSESTWTTSSRELIRMGLMKGVQWPTLAQPPTVSIVMPVFDGMPWLPEAVASVPRDVELIVLDGGSTDGSREWLREHATHAQLVFEPDAGQADALVHGFAKAGGDVLGWLNADDVLEPGAIEVVRSAFADPDVVMASGACLLIDAHSAVIGAMSTPPEPTAEGLARRRVNPGQPATFFRADVYRVAGGIDRSFDLAFDVDLWLRLAQRGRYLTLPGTVLARYRVHRATRTSRHAARSAREDLRARRAQGMPWRSHAGVALIRAAYVTPPMDRLRAAVRSASRRLVPGL